MYIQSSTWTKGAGKEIGRLNEWKETGIRFSIDWDASIACPGTAMFVVTRRASRTWTTSDIRGTARHAANAITQIACTYRDRARRNNLALSIAIRVIAAICHAAFKRKEASQLLVALMFILCAAPFVLLD